MFFTVNIPFVDPSAHSDWLIWIFRRKQPDLLSYTLNIWFWGGFDSIERSKGVSLGIESQSQSHLNH